jgi:hypothetical protein
MEMETTREFGNEVYSLPADISSLKKEYEAIPKFVEDGSAEDERSGFLFRIICMVEGGAAYEDLLQLDVNTLKTLDDTPDKFMYLQEAFQEGKVQRSHALDRVVLARIFGKEQF